jgi:hypothetical protein
VEIHRDLFSDIRFLTTGEVIASAREVAPGLLLPSVHHRIAHNVIHAQIANGDFVAGVFNLRDGLDLARLVCSCGPEFDWTAPALEARGRRYPPTFRRNPRRAPDSRQSASASFCR